MAKDSYVVPKGKRRGTRGTWHRRPGKQEAYLSCPGCGRWGDLLDTHDVQSNGEVYPSVLCDCGFHEQVRLEGW